MGFVSRRTVNMKAIGYSRDMPFVQMTGMVLPGFNRGLIVIESILIQFHAFL
jgi:hypothetical protein